VPEARFALQQARGAPLDRGGLPRGRNAVRRRTSAPGSPGTAANLLPRWSVTRHARVFGVARASNLKCRDVT